VLDLDGVLVLRGALLPGAVEALAALDERGIPFVIGTNMSIVSRATLAGSWPGADCRSGRAHRHCRLHPRRRWPGDDTAPRSST